MTSTINRPTRLDQSPPAGEKSVAARHIVQPYSRSTLVERCLLFTAIVALPLENYFPSVAGMSFSFLLFAAILAYVIVSRLKSLDAIWHHPVFIAAYAFVVVSVLLEFSSPLPDYTQSKRFVEMIVGMMSVAVLCRNRLTLTAGMYGYIVIGLWVSVALYSTGYGTLQGMEADDFRQAEVLRGQAFSEKLMGANLNRLAFVCAQGALVAFALCLSDEWKRFRAPLLGIVAFCTTASFLAMSRGAVVVMLTGFAVILYTRGFRQGKALVLVFVLGMGIYAVVPDAVWTRMAFSTEVKASGKMEARAKLYTNALKRLPEYLLAGVGAGNFYNKWAFEKGFAGVRLSPDGKSATVSIHVAHNALIQLTIFWGILALSIFLLIIWYAYRSIPFQCGRDGLPLALVGIMVSLGALLLYGTDFSDKAHALGVGMLIGARQWIWPSGIVPAVEGNRSPSGADRNTSPDRHPR